MIYVKLVFYYNQFLHTYYSYTTYIYVTTKDHNLWGFGQFKYTDDRE